MSQLFSDHTLHVYDSARLCLGVSNFTLMQASITARLRQTGADHAFRHTRLDISTVICTYLHAYALYLCCVRDPSHDMQYVWVCIGVTDMDGSTLAVMVAGGPAELKSAHLPVPHLAWLPQCSSW